jgi:hypothetical protein
MSAYTRNKKWKEQNRDKVSANQRRYRQENGKDITKQSRIKRREILRQKLVIFLSDKTCQNCPENRRPCLCFHHRNPDEKKMQIPQMVDHCYSWDTILTEIKKCDILCHNCHALLYSKPN